MEEKFLENDAHLTPIILGLRSISENVNVQKLKVVFLIQSMPKLRKYS